MRRIRNTLGSLPIVWKLTTSVAVCTIIAIAVSGFQTYKRSEELLLGHAFESMQASLDRQAERLQNAIAEVELDARSISNSRAVIGYERARAAGGYDQMENMTEAGWRQRIERDFSVLVESKTYLQARLISRDTGHELVRVDGIKETNGEAKARVVNALQDKSQSNYVIEGRLLDVGEVLVSQISLNREHGRIIEPWMPTYRVVTPVVGDASLLVVNADASQLMAILENHEKAETVLTNSAGGVLYHPQPGRAWGFEYGRKDSIETFYGLAWADIAAGRQGLVDGAGGGLLQVVGRVPLGVKEDSKFLGLVLTAKQDIILADILELRTQYIGYTLMALLGTVLMAYVAVRRQLQPILALTRAAQDLSSGLENVMIPVSGQDEVSRLGMAFRQLVGNLQRRALGTAIVNGDVATGGMQGSGDARADAFAGAGN